jgi:hypothetical protein
VKVPQPGEGIQNLLPYQEKWIVITFFVLQGNKYPKFHAEILEKTKSSSYQLPYSI